MNKKSKTPPQKPNTPLMILLTLLIFTVAAFSVVVVILLNLRNDTQLVMSEQQIALDATSAAVNLQLTRDNLDIANTQQALTVSALQIAQTANALDMTMTQQALATSVPPSLVPITLSPTPTYTITTQPSNTPTPTITPFPTVTTTFTATAQPLNFSDDFNNGINPAWRNLAGHYGEVGNWITVNGQLLPNQCGLLMIGDSTWQNYVLEMQFTNGIDATYPGLSSFSVIVAYQDTDNYYHLKVSRSDSGTRRFPNIRNYTEWHRVLNSNSSITGTFLDRSFRVDEMNDLRIELRSQSITTYMNGELLYNLGFNEILSGGVGIDACSEYPTSPVFDNFRIVPL